MSDAAIKDTGNSQQLEADKRRLVMARDVGNIRKTAGLPSQISAPKTLKEHMKAHRQWIFGLSQMQQRAR